MDASTNRRRRRRRPGVGFATSLLLEFAPAAAGGIALRRRGRDASPGDGRHRPAAVRGRNRRLNEAKWYPAEAYGVRRCVHDNLYPDAYRDSPAMILFDDEAACCAAYDVCQDAAAAADVAKEAYWYPLLSPDGSIGPCVLNANYPEKFLEYRSVFLFDSIAGCCGGHPASCAFGASLEEEEDGAEPSVAVTAIASTTPATVTASTSSISTATTPETSAAATGSGTMATVTSTSVATTTPETTTATAAASTTITATAEADTTTTAKAARWYPAEIEGERQCVFNDLYPVEYLASPFLYDDEVECCTAYRICPEPAAATAGAKVARWYPGEVDGKRQCVHNDEYPEGYLTSLATFLFDDEMECCEAYMVCPEPVASTAATTTTMTKMRHWYPLITDDGSPDICVSDSDYPDAYLHPVRKSAFLFSTWKECCAAHPSACPNPKRWFPRLEEEGMTCVFGSDYPAYYADYPESHLFESENGCCDFYEICEEATGATVTTTTTGATTTLAASCLLVHDSCPELWYPHTVDGKPRCAFGSDYPSALMNEEFRSDFLFDSQQDCCDAHPEACPFPLIPSDLFLMGGQSNMIGHVTSFASIQGDEAHWLRLKSILDAAGTDMAGDVMKEIYDANSFHEGDDGREDVAPTLTTELMKLYGYGLLDDIDKPLEFGRCSFVDPSRDAEASSGSLGSTPAAWDAGCGGIFGPEISFGRTLEYNMGQQNSFDMVKVAQGGTLIHEHWSPSHGIHWDKLRRAIAARKAAGNNWKAFVWYQGENDALTSNPSFDEDTSVTYLGNLTALVDRVREEMFEASEVGTWQCKEQLPTVIVQIGAWPDTAGGGRVRGAQAQLVADDPRAALVGTSDLSRFYHFDPASMLVIGHRLAMAYHEALRGEVTCAGATS